MRLKKFIIVLWILLFSLTGLNSVQAAGEVLYGIRSSSSGDKDRIVFDLSAMPKYTITSSQGGRDIVIDFAEIDTGEFERKGIKTGRIKNIKYVAKKGHFIVTLELSEDSSYQTLTLREPSRLVVDIFDKNTVKDSSKKPAVSENTNKSDNKAGLATKDVKEPPKPRLTELKLADGLVQKRYVYYPKGNKVRAYLIEVDPKQYNLRPALAQGNIPGREVLSGIAKNTNAVAAINASYFATSGELIGVTKIGGTIVGTTYFDRSAIGIMTDGSFIFGVCSYDGAVKLNGTTLPVSGVNIARGENNLIIYNHAFGKSTRTNEYGLEYIIRKGKVADIRTNNSPIPHDGYVVSVHGLAMDAFSVSGVRVGDSAELVENIGKPWDKAEHIVGAGPRLVENGKVNVTATAEQFPGDIRSGRAPRSAIGVTKAGKVVLAVVDGRQQHSAGLTLTELAELLVHFEVADAINLDGGGSAELIAQGRILNSPSDGSERPIGSAIIVQKK